jgi:TP901 family phage tail tape measure protein
MALEQAGVQLVAQGASEFDHALAAASASVNQFSSAAQSASGRVATSGGVMTGALRQVGALAVNALAAGAAALVGFATGSIQAASEYQKSMSLIAGLTDTSSAEIASLSKQVLNLSTTLPESPKALADALYFISSSGYQGAAAMDILTISAKASAAGLGETKTIADTVTSAMNAYGAQNLSAAQATDILTMAVVKGKGEPDQLAGAFSRVLPIAAQMGVNFQQVAASMATMTNVGISADEAATALRGTLSAFLKPSKEAAKALESLGISAEDVRKSIADKGLLGTLQMLMDKTHGNVAQLAQIIPNVRALTGVLATAGGQSKQYAEALDAMNNSQGRTQKAFEEASKTYDFQSKVLANAFTRLQIAIGSAVLPALGQFIAGLVPVINHLTEFVTATAAGQTWLSTLAGVISSTAVPAITGLAAATLAYALTALPAMIAGLAAAGPALLASATAMSLAVLPLAAIAVAVANVAKAYGDLHEKIASATDQVLGQKSAWVDSAAALASYGGASEEVAKQLAPLADNLTSMRGLIHGEVEELGLLMAQQASAGARANLYTGQITALKDQINQHMLGLAAATDAYNTQEQIILRAQAATMTATANTQDMTSALADNATQIELTDKELDQLAKDLEKTFKDGTKAVQDYVSQAASLMEQLSDKSKAAGDRITADQAEAYAQQAAAQRAHLGAMLSDYTLAQVKLGNITADQADVVLGAIEKQFGVADQTSSRTFLHMEQAIDQFASSGGGSIDELSGHLGALQDDAIATKEKMDALAKKYTAELVQNFKDGKIDAEELRRALEDIPRRVDSEVHVRFTSEGQDTTHVGVGGRAAGGPVSAQTPYMVGEHGPELFVPSAAGNIMPQPEIAQGGTPFGGFIGGIERTFGDMGMRAALAFSRGLASGSGTIDSAFGAITGAIASASVKAGDLITNSISQGVERGTAPAVNALDDLLARIADAMKAGDAKDIPVPGRASGGPVAGGHSYLVGERGVPEWFTPSQSGMVAPPASASQIQTQRTTNNSSVYSPTYNYSPIYGRAPKAPVQDFHAMKAWGA